MQLSSLIRLMRPHQYVKNIFLFLPLFFALKIDDLHLLSNATIAFVAFSITASSVYILNDYLDIEEDKRHPKKKSRPLASGLISKQQGLWLMALLFLLGSLLMYSIALEALWILWLYVGMNVAYSFSLKHVAILDVVTIAIGFVLRLFVGSATTGIALSEWIVIMTFLLALFMALAKRRDDVLIYLDTGKKMRKVIDGYNLQFLDAAMAIMASVVIVAYIIYTTTAPSPHTHYLYLTSLFVIVAIMRYLQIAFVLLDSGSPTKIVLSDKFMQLTIVGWFIAFAWILY